MWNIQWHALQYLGRTWARSDVAHSTESMVNYSKKVIERGGVITFDVGVYGEKAPDGRNAPYLRIPADQFSQLCAVRDAVRSINR